MSVLRHHHAGIPGEQGVRSTKYELVYNVHSIFITL